MQMMTLPLPYRLRRHPGPSEDSETRNWLPRVVRGAVPVPRWTLDGCAPGEL